MQMTKIIIHNMLISTYDSDVVGVFILYNLIIYNMRKEDFSFSLFGEMAVVW